jgi:endonuclease/exonuclease/phosphatase family metal-dependent hydrolase
VSADPTEIRLLTYNVHGLRSGISSVAAVIRAAAPDVVVLQEGPRAIRWRTRCAELARQAGLVYVAGGRPSRGNVILSSVRAEARATTAGRFTRTPRQQVRGAAAALLDIAGIRLGVIGLHAGLWATERRRHAAEIARLADGLRSAGAAGVVMAGDFNEGPTAGSFADLRSAYRDAWTVAPEGGEMTWPDPPARIDWVLVDSAVEVLGCGVPDLPLPDDTVRRASDHLPVLARIRLPAGRSAR